MDEDKGPSSLEQSLRDERARRKEAESRIEDLTERAAVWRGRAEERAATIARLESALETRKGRVSLAVRRLGGRISRLGGRRASLDPSSAPATAMDSSTTVSHRSWPALKSVLVVHAMSDGPFRRCVDSFDTVALSEASAGDMDRADMVVVEPESLSGIAAESRDRLLEWAGQPGRQPLVVWTSRSDLTPLTGLVGPGDVVATGSPDLARAIGAVYLPPCFDPGPHHPGFDGAGTEPISDSDMGHPDVATVESAACGVGFDTSPGAGVAARRWAYRHHAPWIRAGQLLSLAGLRAADPIPRIAGILVSNRPSDVPGAIRSFLGQTHVNRELVVGIHGGSPTPEIESLLSEASIPVELVVLDAGLTLGECLNQAIARSSAPVLAKIDDDDHYGPAHLEDSFHALAYSGAGIVGKAAHYAYMAAGDETVLRRPGQEEAFIDGSPVGATLVFRRSVWDAVGFPFRPRHVDTGFVRAARSIGTTAYAASRWEFCVVRRPEGHTWEVEESKFIAGSDPAWPGFHPERVEVADLGAL